jgi:hypothetical protein
VAVSFLKEQPQLCLSTNTVKRRWKKMGMYDTILVEDQRCPVCHKRNNFDFQTQVFERNLNVWHIGEIITNRICVLGSITETPLRMFQDISAVLSRAVARCPNCKCFLRADFLIYHSQILACLKITNDIGYYDDNLEDYLTYFLDWDILLEKIKPIKEGDKN